MTGIKKVVIDRGAGVCPGGSARCTIFYFEFYFFIFFFGGGYKAGRRI